MTSARVVRERIPAKLLADAKLVEHGVYEYQEVLRDPVVLPARVHNPDYLRSPVPKKMYVPPVY